jgi:penicillin V acylase-like amidase (Ntn superfamily)
MSKFLSLVAGMALTLLAAQAADACTSIRIKTEDGLVFYARWAASTFKTAWL